MAIWGGKTLPKELGTCKDVQGTHRNTYDHLVSLEFTGILKEHKGVEEGDSLAREIERERRQRGKELLTERGQERSTGLRSPKNSGRRWGVVAGEGGDRQRPREREAENREKWLPGLGRERGKVF
jgi:hypothetical protein